MKNSLDEKIIEFLHRTGYSSVNEISTAVYCSSSTVRRRLASLASKGIVFRTHGGATLNDGEAVVSDFSYRMDRNSAGKKRIAIAAAKLVKDGDVVFLDDSTSAFYIVPYLAELKNVQVMTNGIDTLNVLTKYHIASYSSGGKVDPTNKSALIGELAESAIGGMYYDVMFFSVYGVNKYGVASDPSIEGNTLRRSAMNNSKKTVFLCDSEKFDKTSVFKSFDLKEVDVIISDIDVKEQVDREDLPETICVKGDIG